MLIPQLFCQARRGVTSFFNRISGEELWRGSTSVRSAGRKSGRHMHLRKPKDLNRGQTIGIGRIRTEFPGLNAAIYDRQMKIAAAPLQIRSPEAEYQQKLNDLRQRLERKRGKEKVHSRSFYIFNSILLFFIQVQQKISTLKTAFRLLLRLVIAFQFL